MTLYKYLSIVSIILGSFLFTQCGSVPTSENQETMTLSQPVFASSSAYFNTYTSGVQGGGSGIEFYFDIDRLPEGVVLEKLYFRKGAGKLMLGTGVYVARFRTDDGKDQDINMSSNPEEEATNTPPSQGNVFPFSLLKNEAGLTYREQGVLKYAKISNVEERASIAYPGQRPRGNGY